MKRPDIRYPPFTEIFAAAFVGLFRAADVVGSVVVPAAVAIHRIAIDRAIPYATAKFRDGMAKRARNARSVRSAKRNIAFATGKRSVRRRH